MSDFFNFITDDWQKIPQNLRWLFIAGILLIFNTWLLDHWYGSNKAPFLVGWFSYFDVIEYAVGYILILMCFGMLVSKQLIYFAILRKYRSRYDLQKIEKDFYLAWFNGKLMLFDVKDKKYYHIYPWETAQDLLFVGQGDQLPFEFAPDVSFPVGITGVVVDVLNYKNGGSINTRS